MNDCDWIAARTLTEAVDCLLEFSGESREEALKEEPHALSDAEMRRLTFVTEDEEENVVDVSGAPVYKRHAFAVELQRLIDEGATFPRYFATTEC